MSYNDSGNRDFIVFNFNKVLNCPNIYKKEMKEKSPDSLFYSKNKLYFIELKEGMSNKEDVTSIKIFEHLSTTQQFDLSA
ncbi:hypothetical protein E05_45440 [Plautia stali symbiont]|nr:hypothetical protein E05_45440 [Plautia stali symbiont]